MATVYDFDKISCYFHLPLTDASKQLGICATILKKICRSYGIKRWPHRKIRSIDNLIQKNEEQIKNVEKEDEINELQKEINALKSKREQILRNPNTPINSDPKRLYFEGTFNKSSMPNNVIEECYKIISENEKKMKESDHQLHHQLHHIDDDVVEVRQHNVFPPNRENNSKCDHNTTSVTLQRPSFCLDKKRSRGECKTVQSYVLQSYTNEPGNLNSNAYLSPLKKICLENEDDLVPHVNSSVIHIETSTLPLYFYDYQPLNVHKVQPLQSCNSASLPSMNCFLSSLREV